jgi:hypothetical protein
MTNKQYLVIAQIITVLDAVSAIKYIGEYPDDLSKIGQRFPAVIIEDGNETFDIFSGNQYQDFMDVRLNLFTQVQIGKTKMKAMLDLQATINHALLADLTLAGTCIQIKPVSVEKSEMNNEQGQQISKRVMTYNIEIHDTRS